MRPLVTTKRELNTARPVDLDFITYIKSFSPVAFWDFNGPASSLVFDSLVSNHPVSALSDITEPYALGNAVLGYPGGRKDHYDNKALDVDAGCFLYSDNTITSRNMTWEVLVKFQSASNSISEAIFPFWGRDLRFFYSGLDESPTATYWSPPPLTLYGHVYTDQTILHTVSASMSTALSTGEWYHLTFVRENPIDGSNGNLTMRIYVNGTEIASGSEDYLIVSAVGIGEDLPPAGNFVSVFSNAIIDYAAVYNYVLPASAIAEHSERVFEHIHPKQALGVARIRPNKNFIEPYDQFLNPYGFQGQISFPVREETTGYLRATDYIDGSYNRFYQGMPFGWYCPHTLINSAVGSSWIDTGWGLNATSDGKTSVVIRYDKMNSETGYQGKPFICFSVSGIADNGPKVMISLPFNIRNPYATHILSFALRASSDTLYAQNSVSASDAHNSGLTATLDGSLLYHHDGPSTFIETIWPEDHDTVWPLEPPADDEWHYYEYTVSNITKEHSNLLFNLSIRPGVNGTISFSALSFTEASGSPSYLTPKLQNSTYPYVKEYLIYGSQEDGAGEGNYAVDKAGRRNRGWLPSFSVASTGVPVLVSTSNYWRSPSYGGGRFGMDAFWDKTLYQVLSNKSNDYPDEIWGPNTVMHYGPHPVRKLRGCTPNFSHVIGWEDYKEYSTESTTGTWIHPEWFLWTDTTIPTGYVSEREPIGETYPVYAFWNMENPDLVELIGDRLVNYIRMFGLKCITIDSGGGYAPSVTYNNKQYYGQAYTGGKIYGDGRNTGYPTYSNAPSTNKEWVRTAWLAFREIMTRMKTEGVKIELNMTGSVFNGGQTYAQNPSLTGTIDSTSADWFLDIVDQVIFENSFSYQGNIGEGTESNFRPYPMQYLWAERWKGMVDSSNYCDSSGHYPVNIYSCGVVASTGSNNIIDAVTSEVLRRKTFGFVYSSILMAGSYGHKNVAYSIEDWVHQPISDWYGSWWLDEYHYPTEDWDLGTPCKPYDWAYTNGNFPTSGFSGLARAYYSNSLVLTNVPSSISYLGSGHYRLNGQSYSYTLDQDYYDHISQQTFLKGSIVTLPVGEAFIGEIIR